MMTVLLSIITNWIYLCGVTYAGVPSAHGSYEVPVPARLRGSGASFLFIVQWVVLNSTKMCFWHPYHIIYSCEMLLKGSPSPMVEHLDMEQMFATGDDHMLKKQATVVIVLMLVSLMLSTAYAAEKVSVQGLWARSETNQGIKAEAKWYDAFQSTHENARIDVTHKSIYRSTKSLLKALDNS
ncbi:MAG: hypothetical protein RSB18_10205, partial [Clostridia bacterium]